MIINPLVWYTTRKLKITPLHFIKCTTPLSDNSLEWVINKLQGRYSIEDENEDDFFSSIQYIFFEDPSEATVYELRWAGTK